MRATTKKTLRDLLRQRGQVIAVGITIALGVALYVASAGAFLNLSTSYQHTYDRLHFADLVATGGDPTAVAQAALDAGADAAITRTQTDPPMEIGGIRLLGRVISVPDQGRPAIDDVDVIDGTYLSGASGEVLVEKHAAATFGLSPGDTVRVFGNGAWHDATVAGIVVSPEYLWAARNRQEVIADPHSFAVVFAAESTVTAWLGDAPTQALALLPAGAPTSTSDGVAAAMRDAGAADVTTWDQQASHATLKEDLDGFDQMSVAFPLLFLTAAGVASYVMLARRILRERPVIGTLMASGARPSRVMRHYLSQGLVVGLAASVLGVGVGALLNSGITTAYTAELGIPDTIVENHPVTLLYGLLFGPAVGLIGAFFPALSAARTAPAAAMRPATPAHRPGAFGRALARWNGLSVSTRMALRDVGRNRRRTLATALGSVLALVVVLSSVGLMTSMVSAFGTQFDVVQLQDATITVVHGGPDADALAAVNGVATVEPTSASPVTVASDGKTYATALIGLEPETSMHTFMSPRGAQMSLPADGVLAGSALGDTLGVKPGDTITITSDAGSATATLVGFVEEPLGTQLYATLSEASTLAGSAASDDTSSYLVSFDPNADREALRASITSMDGVVAYQDAHAVQDLVSQYMGLFWVFIGAMIALGSVLALAVIYVTMAVSIAERMGELATLRAAGVPVRRVARTIATENLVATALGIPVGLVLGVWGAWAMLQSFSNDLFTLPLVLPWWLLPLCAVGVLAAASLSQLPAIRAVRRVDVATVVRERAA